MIVSIIIENTANTKQENTLNSNLKRYPACSLREDVSEYVAHLQLHMTLQARNLLPSITHAKDSRELLLQQTQAHFEKRVSRQAL
jgi:hypothetical protein